MRRLLLVVSILTVVAMSGIAADFSHAAEDVPFKLRGLVALTGTVELDDDPNYVFQNSFAGEANATQLGKHPVAGVQIFTVSNTAVVGIPLFGTFSQTETHTAANGDELTVVSVGVFLVLPIDVGGTRPVFAPIAGQGAWQITGGTGRFEDATGSGTVATGLNADGAITFELEGEISSLGSRGGNGKN